MKRLFQNISEAKFFSIMIFLVSLTISIVSVQYFFTRDYNILLNQVKTVLTNFSEQREDLISQFLFDKGENIVFDQSKGLMDVIEIKDGEKQIQMNDLRKLLYVEQQQKMRINAYLVSDKGAILTANEEFDNSLDRTTTKIVRNDLIDDCLNGIKTQDGFYIGIDEGNRSVFGTYKKVSSILPLCLFTETEKVTNIDVPAQNILKKYIFFGLLFVALMTFLGGYFSSFSSPFTTEELLLFVLCGVAGLSYTFLVTLFTRGVNYFSIETHFTEIIMAAFSFSLLIIVSPIKKCKSMRNGALLLGIYFLFTIFFEEYRQAYGLSSIGRNFILVMIRLLGIVGFLLLFFNFKKNIKL